MHLFERARLYGQAVQILDEFLGETVREKVMEQFAHIAASAQRRGLKDPWDVIARSARKAGVAAETITALQIVYALRTGRTGALPPGLLQPGEAVLEQLQNWRVLADYERQLRDLGVDSKAKRT